MVISGTRQQRRDRYLELAVEAEIAGAKVSDPIAKSAWIDFAVCWMMMASDICDWRSGGSSARIRPGARFGNPV